MPLEVSIHLVGEMTMGIRSNQGWIQCFIPTHTLKLILSISLKPKFKRMTLRCINDKLSMIMNLGNIVMQLLFAFFEMKSQNKKKRRKKMYHGLLQNKRQSTLYRNSPPCKCRHHYQHRTAVTITDSTCLLERCDFWRRI